MAVSRPAQWFCAAGTAISQSRRARTSKISARRGFRKMNSQCLDPLTALIPGSQPVTPGAGGLLGQFVDRQVFS
jgi:hypothetical protein